MFLIPTSVHFCRPESTIIGTGSSLKFNKEFDSNIKIKHPLYYRMRNRIFNLCSFIILEYIYIVVIVYFYTQI